MHQPLAQYPPHNNINSNSYTGKQSHSPPSPSTPETEQNNNIHIAKTPSAKVPLSELVSDYGAVDFRQALTVFIAAYNEPSFNQSQLQNAAYRVFLPFQKVSVFHKVKIWIDDPLDHVDGKRALDVIHSCPARTTKKGARKGTKLPARFDTALINTDAIPSSGVTG